MFEVIPGRTMPQGLLLLSALFSYAMIALNQLMLVAMPTYSTYGSQHYMTNNTVNGTTTTVTKPCDNHSPKGFLFVLSTFLGSCYFCSSVQISSLNIVASCLSFIRDYDFSLIN